MTSDVGNMRLPPRVAAGEVANHERNHRDWPSAMNINSAFASREAIDRMATGIAPEQA